MLQRIAYLLPDPAATSLNNGSEVFSSDKISDVAMLIDSTLPYVSQQSLTVDRTHPEVSSGTPLLQKVNTLKCILGTS